MENPETEIVELTKPKRNRKQKVEATPTPAPAPVEVAPIAPTPTPAIDTIPPTPKSTARGRPKKVQPEQPAPQEKPVEQQAPPMSIYDDPDYKLYMKLAQEIEEPPIVKETKKKPVKTIVEKQTEQAPPVKRTTKKQEIDDIYDRIDMIKSRVQDTKIKKSRDENAYLREKLKELEMELEDLRSTPSVPKSTPSSARKVKTVKLPKERVEIIAQGAPQLPTQLPLRQIINSFGF